MKKKHYIIATITVAFIVAVNKIDNEVMPYYAMVHIAALKDAPAALAFFEGGKVTQMHGVNDLFLGWKGLLSLWPLLVPFTIVGSIAGCFVGLRIMKVKKDKEIKELKESIPVLGMTVSGISRRKAELDRREKDLDARRTKLDEEQEELERAQFIVNTDKAYNDIVRRDAEEDRNQLANLKEDHAKRLDKIIRQDKTIERLETKIVDLEREQVELKKENLKLRKENLAHEENSKESRKSLKSPA